MVPRRSSCWHFGRFAVALLVIATAPALATPAGDEARTRRDHWLRQRLLEPGAALPFSFRYDDQPSQALLDTWPRTVASRALDPARTEHTLEWTDPATGLRVRCVAVTYDDFPALEWTVTFRNTGTKTIPILADIQGLDARLERDPDGEFRLRHLRGDTFAPDLYEPHDIPLDPGATHRFAPVGGRGSNGAFPYYNVVLPGGGVFLAVGWPGQWASTFERDADRGLRIVAGQERTHLALEPGEQVRTPLIALLFWQGDDPAQAQNLWRRWMWAHNMPRDSRGQLAPPLLFGNTSLQFNEMCNADEQSQIDFINRYLDAGIPLDFWWMDAGWYPCDGHWPKTGTWEPDPARFPRGLRAISDHARSRGVRTLVWFEPERVAPGTWIAENHPDWLLGSTLLDLGRPEPRAWLTDHVDRVLREQGIAYYRQDFNMDPLDFWRKNDSPERQGLTENLHVQGYLAYWDALRERHPDLLIDSCASGGRRNDLETMRRAVPLHPTDYNYTDLTTKQAFHWSLVQWLPSFGSNTQPIDSVDAYGIRSGHARNLILNYDLRRDDLDIDRLRKLVADWRRIAPFYDGDFYPLTPYNRADDAWLAWQFHRPESGDGLVEAFRRPQAGAAERAFPLAGLDPAARYEITDLDSGTTTTQTGQDLMDSGVRVAIAAQPGALALTYRKLD